MLTLKTLEVNKNNLNDVAKIYENKKVLFEHTILKSDCLIYSLCYVPSEDLYDIVIENYILGKHIIYEARKYISGTTKKYFNLYKNDEYRDFHGTVFTCLSHTVEYE